MEDRSNQARGHKAALSNPHVSKEAKRHSREVLRDEFGNEAGFAEEAEGGKSLGHV